MACFSVRAFSQDIIYTLKGQELKCKVDEIGEDSISYFAPEAPKALKKIVSKEVAKIKSANGWDWSNPSTPAPAAVTQAATTTEKKADVAISATESVIITLDGTQIPCKITEIDDDNHVVNYLVAGNATAQTISTKNVSRIKSGSGAADIVYNKPAEAITAQPEKKLIANNTVRPMVKKPAEPAPEKENHALLMLNWKRKYTSPPLEIF